MQLNAYLLFNGNCEEAFRFYERTLGAKIESVLRPEGAPGVMHGRIAVNGQTVMASDCPPNHYTQPKGFSINLSYQQPADAERVFQALSEGGHVQMPIQETFWAHRFGSVVDRFGIPWMVNCEKARIELEKMPSCQASSARSAA